MTIKVRITFTPVANRSRLNREVVVNSLEVPFEMLTVGDLTDRITETEAYLSRILGMVAKIETGAE